MNQSSNNSITINLRNKGLKSAAGTLVKGCVKDATTKLSIGSIPSNYQTIIYQHNSSNAFGSSQKRFYQQKKNQIDKNLIPDESMLNQTQPKINVSHSTKGWGPFIAREQRKWLPKNFTPGPGKYQRDQQAKTADTQIKKKKRKFIPSLFTTDKSLHKSKQEKQNKIQKNDLPGPGQYYIFEQKSVNNGWKSSFKSKLNRSSYIPNKQTPGPGFYQIKQAQKKNKIVILENKQNIGSPQKLSPKKFFPDYQKNPKPQIPGPGTYQHQIPSFKPLYQRIKISGNFILSKKDRFNMDVDSLGNYIVNDDTPNVYSYDQKSIFDNQKRLLKWPCFMSQCKRKVFDGEKNIGPSFIIPKCQDKKNFHFNIKGGWL